MSKSALERALSDPRATVRLAALGLERVVYDIAHPDFPTESVALGYGDPDAVRLVERIVAQAEARTS
jgi:hypothetical protein